MVPPGGGSGGASQGGSGGTGPPRMGGVWAVDPPETTLLMLAELSGTVDGVPRQNPLAAGLHRARDHAGPADGGGRLSSTTACGTSPRPCRRPAARPAPAWRPSRWTSARRPSPPPSRALRPGTSCPGRAVTIAYATALQESQAGEPDLRRPRFGRRLPAAALAGLGPRAPTWRTRCTPRPGSSAPWSRCTATPELPVYQAAQDVQHSADGSAYEQYAEVATLLAKYFTGGCRTGCPAGTRHRAKADLASALRRAGGHVRAVGARRVVVGVSTDRSARISSASRDGRARPADRELDGGQLAGGQRPAVRHQRGTVCRL